MQEYYSQYNTGKTNNIIKMEEAKLHSLWTKTHNVPESFFMTLASNISLQNINKDGTWSQDLANIEGGPFAAVIVQYEGGLDNRKRGIGKPSIIGIGANHVVPEKDPSAHGEMSAIRDASQRLNHSDLFNTVMFTSCECCPQCQAAIAGAGIARVVFANDRFDAAAIGFSDKEQYYHIDNIFGCMQHIDAVPNKAKLLDILGKHGAVIINEEGKAIAFGDIDIKANDPLSTLPSMNAIRNACKIEGSFHLPENYILLTRNMIHPAAFTTADWARIGRIRDKECPNDPTKDVFEKDASKIIFINKEFEEMQVKDKNGNKRIINTAANILEDIKLAPENRNIVVTEQIAEQDIQDKSVIAFKKWKEIIQNEMLLKY